MEKHKQIFKTALVKLKYTNKFTIRHLRKLESKFKYKEGEVYRLENSLLFQVGRLGLVLASLDADREVVGSNPTRSGYNWRRVALKLKLMLVSVLLLQMELELELVIVRAGQRRP